MEEEAEAALSEAQKWNDALEEERERVRELRERRDGAASECRALETFVNEERLRRSKAFSEDSDLRRRELGVASLDLERAQKEVKELIRTNARLGCEIDNFKGTTEDSKEEQHVVFHMDTSKHAAPLVLALAEAPPRFALARAVRVRGPSSKADTPVLRLQMDDDQRFYRVPRHRALKDSLEEILCSSRRPCSAAEEGEETSFLTWNDRTLDLAETPASLGLEDLALLHRHHPTTSPREEKPPHWSSVLVVVRSPDASVSDAYYFLEPNDMLDGLFKVHANKCSRPQLGFFTANGERQLRPAETPNGLGFIDIGTIMVL